MDKTDNLEDFQIKVNRINSEKEKLIPYSKYIKNNYPQLSKVVPKHSILYKVKYRPEIVINEFHQTSNNYNTNINIKTNLNNKRNDTYNLNIKLNNDYPSPYSTDYLNNNKINSLPKNQSINLKIENESYQNSNSPHKMIEVNKKSKENKKIFNTVKYKRYQKNKNYSMGLINLFNSNNKMNTENYETSVESLSNNGNNINKILFLSNQKENNSPSNININNIKDPTIVKMEIYRIKLFKEFLKHFQNFYKIHFLKLFFNRMKTYKKKKQIIKNRTIENYYKPKLIKTSLLLNNINNDNNSCNDKINTDINAVEMLKSSTTKDYYEIYKQLKQHQNINSNLKNLFNNYNNNNLNIKNNIDFNDKNKHNDNISLSMGKTTYMNITPKINRNINFSSTNKRKDNQSPSFHIGNKIILNRDISFGKDKNDKNELFRDSKQLNKKYQQIQRRRKKIHFFNKSMGVLENINTDNKMNISNEFNEIKKYIQENKKENQTHNEKFYRKTVNSVKKSNLNDKFVNIRNINGKKYKIMKVNVNKNLLNKNNIYYSKKVKKENKLFSIVVKNIVSKDNLIHININYYFIKDKDKNKNIKERYDSLEQTNTFSISILSDKDTKRKNKFKLTSIKEEDLSLQNISIQNSKIFEENDIKYNDNKDKDLFDFIKNINNILIKKYKKIFIYKIKTIELIHKINNIFNNKKNEIEDNNINNKVYSKKFVNKNKEEKRTLGIFNKNSGETSADKINKLRYKLIKYSIKNLKKSKI